MSVSDTHSFHELKRNAYAVKFSAHAALRATVSDWCGGMKLSTHMQEIRGKSREELQRMLAEERERLRGLRFKESQSQLSNVRDVRKIRLSVARMLTAMNESRKKGSLLT